MVVLKKIFYLILVFLTVSCSAGKKLNSKTKTDKKDLRAILTQNALDHKSLEYARGKYTIALEDGKNKMAYDFGFRIRKNKTVWLDGPFRMVRLRADSVNLKFYSRLDQSYYDSDFNYLVRLLGFDVSMKTIQNILLGQPIFNLSNSETVRKGSENEYTDRIKKLNYSIVLDSLDSRVRRQSLVDKSNNYSLFLEYDNFYDFDGIILPKNINLIINKKNEVFNIEMECKRLIKSDNNLKFPYKVPAKYDEIVLKEI